MPHSKDAIHLTISSVGKGLIIDKPWISLILAGQKDWEMRSTTASHRGWFALIWKGMGAVYGVARLVDVKPPLTHEQMLQNIEHHQIPAEMLLSGDVSDWTTPWILADVKRLDTPIPYRHKNGAVTWVNLDDDVSEAIVRQLNKREEADPVIGMDDAECFKSSQPTVKLIGEIEIRQANIEHNHIYLHSLFDHFPQDAIGGSNKSAKAKREIIVDWGRDSAWTDLDGTKKLFRSRKWTRLFFASNNIKAGDKVLIEEVAPYQYRVRPARSSAG